MAFLLADRVAETTTTTGTGSFALAGPTSDARGFAAAGTVAGDTVPYVAELPGTAHWECGIGTWTNGTLARTTVTSSSNGGAAVNFPAGQKIIRMTLLAANSYVPLSGGGMNGPLGMTGGSTVWRGDGSDSDLTIYANPGAASLLRFGKDWKPRWAMGANNAPESGSNAGSNFAFQRYADDGSYLDTPLQISRLDGRIFLGNVEASSLTTGTVTASGQVTATSFQTTANAYWSLSGANPVLNFDSNDYLLFNRSSNLFSTVVGGTTRFSVSASQITAALPLILPATQSTNVNAAVHKTYVDNAVSAANANANGRLSLTGGTVTGGINATSFNVATNAGFYWDGVNPILAFDNADYIAFSRATNTLSFNVNGASPLGVSTGGVGINGTLWGPGRTIYQTGAAVRTDWTSDGWYDEWNSAAGTRYWCQPGLTQMWLTSGGHLSTAGNIAAGGVITTNGGAGLTVVGTTASGGNSVTTVLTSNPSWEPMYLQAIHVPGQWAGKRIVVGSSATKAWDFRNDGNAYSHGSWIDASDGRVKVEREVITDALDKVATLTGYTYTRTDLGGRREVGLIAQDVRKVLPEAVYVDHEPMDGGDGFHSMSYNGATALIVNALNEAAEKIARLEARLAAVEARNV